MPQLTNWAGNVTFGAARVHHPSSVDELRDLVAGATRARALGTGHSFNRLADTTGDLISVAGLPGAIALGDGTVTVTAGTRYGELAAYLHERGHALHNLGSLPHISVAGACATGTHGSGDGNGNLATAVRAIELVTADGGLVTLDRADDRFAAATVGLGSLGVVTALTLAVQPAYQVRQYVYEGVPFAHWAEAFAAGHSVSLFTYWRGDRFDQVWVKLRDGQPAPPERWLGATRADGPRHPVPGMPAGNCTTQGGVPGPWHARLPHFRLEFTPSAGDELQSEYLLAREHATDALAALSGARERIASVLQVCELRTVAADDLWLSPSYRRESVAVHFTWGPDEAAVAPVIAEVERRLAPFAPRPHWGKVFTVPPPQVAAAYPRIGDFAALAARMDPGGTFRNAMLDRYVHGALSAG